MSAQREVVEVILSANCNISNIVTNTTAYSFALLSDGLEWGNWVITPQPIPAAGPAFNAFQAVGTAGTATGAQGNATYSVIQNGTSVGTFTFYFDDPWSGRNSCSSSSTVEGLSASNNCPSGGSTFAVSWTISAS